jgi:hypothetical protein
MKHFRRRELFKLKYVLSLVCDEFVVVLSSIGPNRVFKIGVG